MNRKDDILGTFLYMWEAWPRHRGISLLAALITYISYPFIFALITWWEFRGQSNRMPFHGSDLEAYRRVE